MNHSIICLSIDAIRRIFSIQDENILQKASRTYLLAREKNQRISLCFSKSMFLSLLKEKLSKEECQKIDLIQHEQDTADINPEECEISPDVFN